jgi:hypothetical protein
MAELISYKITFVVVCTAKASYGTSHTLLEWVLRHCMAWKINLMHVQVLCRIAYCDNASMMHLSWHNLIALVIYLISYTDCILAKYVNTSTNWRPSRL